MCLFAVCTAFFVVQSSRRSLHIFQRTTNYIYARMNIMDYYELNILNRPTQICKWLQQVADDGYMSPRIVDHLHPQADRRMCYDFLPSSEMQASSLKRERYDDSGAKIVRYCLSAFINDLCVSTTSFRTPAIQTFYPPCLALQTPTQDYITMPSSAILATIFAAIVGTASGKKYSPYGKCSGASKAMKLCTCTYPQLAGRPSSCL